MSIPIETDIQPAPPTARAEMQPAGWRAVPPAGGSIRRIAIRTIRPTQVTVGFREVDEKRRRRREALAAGRTALPRQPVPVVLGPDATPYALDRHHWLCALLAEDVEMVRVRVVDDLSGLEPTAFWRVLEQRGWCHPYDQHGRRQACEAIPASLEELLDDPFRSLASALRRAGGFKKDRTLFSEFRWATYLRGRVDPSALTGDFEGAVATAQRLTRRRSGPLPPVQVPTRITACTAERSGRTSTPGKVRAADTAAIPARRRQWQTPPPNPDPAAPAARVI